MAKFAPAASGTIVPGRTEPCIAYPKISKHPGVVDGGFGGHAVGVNACPYTQLPEISYIEQNDRFAF